MHRIRITFGIRQGEASVDELDSALVCMLQEDGRRTNRDMAQALGIAPSTCLERIRLLRQRGILTGIHAEADLTAIGRGLLGRDRHTGPPADACGDRGVPGIP